MTGAPSTLADLLADCDAHGIQLLATGDDCLTIDAPQDALKPELVDRIRAHKSELLTLLQSTADFDNEGVADSNTTAFIDSIATTKAICRCGSTTWREVPIHDGQSIRRDCGRCGRFLGWPLWYRQPDQVAVERAISGSAANGEAVAHA
jgi:hypothetical protein